jgi:phosphoenolpyruvate-protein kinase (PTS system EI component)|tara:strand:+ start:132 stop:494 length:363 start_codon:yes stop_codon:yes gene_type:complete
MFALARAPTHIYNTIKKETEEKPKHWRQHPNRVRRRVYAVNSPKVNEDTLRIKKLENEVDMYKKAHQKMKMIATWSLRANEAALSDSRTILHTLEELYGDEAFEDQCGKSLNTDKGDEKN